MTSPTPIREGSQACTAYADACLAEELVQQLKQCIRFNLDCADVCAATGALASRRTGTNEQILRQMLQVCAAACQVCGEECQRPTRPWSLAGPSSGRVVRGGSWNDEPRNLRSANRNRNEPNDRNNTLGFRVASTLPCPSRAAHGPRRARG